MAVRIWVLAMAAWLCAGGYGRIHAQEVAEAPAPPPPTPQLVSPPEAAPPAPPVGTPEIPAAEAAAAAVPSIACDAPVFQFGEVDTDSVVPHTFVIRNDGNAVLEIGKVKPSCGCTVANISSRSLQPGETAEIETKLSLKGKVGKQRKTIGVQSNDPNKPNLVLTMEGDSLTAVDVKPRRLYVNDVTRGETSEHRVEIISNEETPIEIIEFSTGNPHITAELETLEEGRKYALLITTSADLPRGPTHGRIQVKTSSTKVPNLNVPFQFNVVGELAVAPKELAMVEQPEAALTRNVVIRPGSVKEFKVLTVVPPLDSIEATVRDMAGNGFMIQLSNIQPSMELNGQNLRITTDASGMEEILVPFRVVQRPNTNS